MPCPNAYFAPSSTDSRSPCPALNALANHGYLPRNGHNISADHLLHALRNGFGLSAALATLLTYGGFFIMQQFRHLSLSDISRHNLIEHDASLAHCDTEGDREYAPRKLDAKLFEAFMQSSPNVSLSIDDVARVRNERENDSVASGHAPLDTLHTFISQGEVALIYGLFGDAQGNVSKDALRAFFVDERMPEGWTPSQELGFCRTKELADRLRASMKSQREADVEADRVPVKIISKAHTYPFNISPLSCSQTQGSGAVRIPLRGHTISGVPLSIVPSLITGPVDLRSPISPVIATH